MKRFIYLVQGEANLVKSFFHLADRADVEAIFMTYDREIEGAVFFPNSTWSQGRNKLLELALKKSKKYLYYIFCDDDVVFKTGTWDDFESQILTLKPAIAVPINHPKTKNTPIKGLPHQTFLVNDEQLLAVHRDVIDDGILFPYQSQFDKTHWWAACEIQELLIQNFYPTSAIQFNNIHVINDCRLRYNNPEEGRNSFKKDIRDWLNTQFITHYNEIHTNTIDKKRYILWRTFLFHAKRIVFFLNQSRSSKSLIPKLLSKNSELYKKINRQ